MTEVRQLRGTAGGSSIPDSMESLRITVVHSEPPFPDIHGGRAEVWGRLKGFRALGVRVQLLCWADVQPSEGELEQMRSVCEEVVVLRPRSRAFALLERRYPPKTRRLLPGRRMRAELFRQVRAFAPRFVLLDNWPCFLFASELSSSLQLPLVFRSHNVEVDYWRGMLTSSTGMSRLRLSVNTKRIGVLERELRSFADVVLDISEEDRRRSAQLGQEGQSFVLPGTRLAKRFRSVDWEDRDIDILFAGNLWAPNNVNGILWFCQMVVPLLSKHSAKLRIVLAGARPAAEVRVAAARCGIECLADPDDIDGLRARAKVLMNPQLQYGGLMQKMLDYLAHEAWIVTTQVGAAGLTGEVPSSLLVRDEADDFAAELALRASGEAPSPGSGAVYIEREFGLARLRASLERIVATVPEVMGR